MLGFIILVGTVVNNPILIVEQALNHVRDDGMDDHAAVLESVRTRIRPIFMTALIGFFGLVPLVISPGAGSELYRGLGAVLLGGLLVSTIFTLFLVPSLFTLTLEAKDFLVRLLFGHAGEEVPEWERQHIPSPETVAVRHAQETHVLQPSLTPVGNGESLHASTRTPTTNGDNGHAASKEGEHSNGDSAAMEKTRASG
jgi:HAE1 family hydrophobic/amphiphilic exporter-1